MSDDIARCGTFQIKVKPNMVDAGARVIMDSFSAPDEAEARFVADLVFKAMFAECKK